MILRWLRQKCDEIRGRRLSELEATVLVFVARRWHYQLTRPAWTHVSDVAEELELDRKRARWAVARLAEHGFIRIGRSAGGGQVVCATSLGVQASMMEWVMPLRRR